MSKFAIINYVNWFTKELTRKNKFTWKNIFKKSWIFLIFLITLLVFLRLLLTSLILLILILIGIEFFNWLAGKH